jgi:hypothetical protein
LRHPDNLKYIRHIFQHVQDYFSENRWMHPVDSVTLQKPLADFVFYLMPQVFIHYRHQNDLNLDWDVLNDKIRDKMREIRINGRDGSCARLPLQWGDGLVMRGCAPRTRRNTLFNAFHQATPQTAPAPGDVLVVNDEGDIPMGGLPEMPASP